MEADWLISVIIAGTFLGASWVVIYRMGLKKGYQEGTLHARMAMLQGMLDARKRAEKMAEKPTDE